MLLTNRNATILSLSLSLVTSYFFVQIIEIYVRGDGIDNSIDHFLTRTNQLIKFHERNYVRTRKKLLFSCN